MVDTFWLVIIIPIIDLQLLFFALLFLFPNFWIQAADVPAVVGVLVIKAAQMYNSSHTNVWAPLGPSLDWLHLRCVQQRLCVCAACYGGFVHRLITLCAHWWCAMCMWHVRPCTSWMLVGVGCEFNVSGFLSYHHFHVCTRSGYSMRVGVGEFCAYCPASVHKCGFLCARSRLGSCTLGRWRVQSVCIVGFASSEQQYAFRCKCEAN